MHLGPLHPVLPQEWTRTELLHKNSFIVTFGITIPVFFSYAKKCILPFFEREIKPHNIKSLCENAELVN